MDKQVLSQTGFMTQAIHAGQEPDPAYGSLATPIYQTSTFCFDDIDDGIAKFNGTKPGYVYSRGGNPTVRALEEKLTVLEGGQACVATGSGMGAIGSVVMGFLSAGDHVVLGDCVYGCTSTVICDLLPKFGITVSIVDTADLDQIKAALQPNTKMIYFETPTNPLMQLTDIARVKALVDGRDIRVVVDNTFAPPPIQYPLKEGADIVVHSATKYLNGHGDVIAGAIIGSTEDIAYLRGFAVTRISGSVCSPFNAYLVLRGLQTLGLRMERHCQNAQAIAEYLQTVPEVSAVLYPGLTSHPQHALALRQMNGQYSGMLSFELQEGAFGLSSLEAGKRLINALNIVHIAVSLGDPSSLIEHPATMTHHNLDADTRAKMGISDRLIRFSAGLEETADLIADFTQAFEQLRNVQ